MVIGQVKGGYMSKWFEFENGSNPYGVWDYRQDEFFRMVCAWRPTMINRNNFRCPKEPTRAYYEAVDYAFKKNALKQFASEYIKCLGLGELERMTADEIFWYKEFFRTYGKRYGLLREFKIANII